MKTLIRFVAQGIDPFIPSVFNDSNTFNPDDITGKGVFCFVVDRDIDMLAEIANATNDVAHIMPTDIASSIIYGEGFYLHNNEVIVLQEAYVTY